MRAAYTPGTPWPSAGSRPSRRPRSALNYNAELTAFGLELAEIPARHDDLNARRDLQSLARIGVLGPERARRLERLRELRRLVVRACAKCDGRGP